MKFLLLLLIAISCACQNSKEDQWQSLFDGQSLEGWEALPGGTWLVKEGCIAGIQQKSERRHGMLISKKEYSDFEIKLKFKALQGNSGFYFRVKKVKHHVSVKGFQAEIDANSKSVGGLYETLGRGWVVKLTPEEVQKFYKPKEWNEMTIRAVGRHVLVHVNGTKTVELKNDPSSVKGFFGLQLHGGQDMNVLYKDIYIKDLSAKEHQD